MIQLPTIPSIATGVYLFKDNAGKVIYVGKAKSLSIRIKTHFYDKDSKWIHIIQQTHNIAYLVTSSEEEALILECNLIKLYRPRYNIRLRDDKTYPLIKITNEPFPRIHITRKIVSDGAKYFGPYTDSTNLRKVIRLIKKMFKIRTCKWVIKPGKNRIPCMDYHLKQCVAPCTGEILPNVYSEYVREAELFLKGKVDHLLKRLQKRMERCAKKFLFEEAADLRDQIRVIEKAVRCQREILSVDKSTLSKELSYDNTFNESLVNQYVGLGITPTLYESVINQLQKEFSLPKLPIRIEAVDISCISQKSAVGALVVFEDGKPKRSEYRRYKIKDVSLKDDLSMMGEVLNRRFKRLIDEGATIPDMILIDGGRQHLNLCWGILQKLGLSSKIHVLALAKRDYDKIYTVALSSSIILPQDSKILHFLQHIRDEAHRFAITYHRKLHRKLALCEVEA